LFGTVPQPTGRNQANTGGTGLEAKQGATKMAFHLRLEPDEYRALALTLMKKIVDATGDLYGECDVVIRMHDLKFMDGRPTIVSPTVKVERYRPRIKF